MAEEGFWGKKEIQATLDHYVEKGDSRTKQEIMREIREQDPDLAKQEKQMIKLGLMIVGIGISFFARRYLARALEKHFA